MDIILENRIVERVKHVKFLGVNFDDNLKWSHPVDNIETKITCVAGKIFALWELFPTWLKRQRYLTLIQSRLQHCLLIWASTCPYMYRLHVLQKNSMQSIDNVPRFVHTALHFVKNQIRSINQLLKWNLSEYAFAAPNSEPTDFYTLYARTSADYNLRLYTFTKPKAPKNYFNWISFVLQGNGRVPRTKSCQTTVWQGPEAHLAGTTLEIFCYYMRYRNKKYRRICRPETIRGANTQKSKGKKKKEDKIHTHVQSMWEIAILAYIGE